MDVLSDIGLALVFLLSFSIAMVNLIEIANFVFSRSGMRVIVWQDQVTKAIESPVTHGIFLIGLLITTLVPTAIHMYYGLASIWRMPATPWW